MTRTKKCAIVCIAGTMAVGLAWAGVAFVLAVIDVPKRAYAVWWTADLVIEYMESHQGTWPRNWEELRPLTEPTSRVTESKEPDGRVIVEFRPTPSVDELRHLVEVDWDADVDQLIAEGRQGKSPPFRVIYLRDGRTTHYEGREPNQMILDYLEARQRRKDK